MGGAGRGSTGSACPVGRGTGAGGGRWALGRDCVAYSVSVHSWGGEGKEEGGRAPAGRGDRDGRLRRGGGLLLGPGRGRRDDEEGAGEGGGGRRGEVRGQRSEMREGRLGAFGQGGLPGVAWLRSWRWLVLGPGRGRRDDEEGWFARRVVRHGPFDKLRAGPSIDSGPAHDERGGWGSVVARKTGGSETAATGKGRVEWAEK